MCKNRGKYIFSACHAGGREFESRRSRHSKTKAFSILLKAFLFCGFFVCQPYFQPLE